MILLSTNLISKWFSLVRNTEPEKRDRVLECFWNTQLSAKEWLIQELSNIPDIIPQDSNVYIFGGWYGVLASMMTDTRGVNIENLYSIDIDPECEEFGKKLDIPKIQFVTANMADYNYSWDYPPQVVINTSSEHVEQGVYDTWYDKIPRGTIVVVQGNNYYSCSEHVRCSKSLSEFKIMNHVLEPLYAGELTNPQYTRYMGIWRK